MNTNNRVPVEVKKTSDITGKENTMTMVLDPADLELWLEGNHNIQAVLGYLNADEREFLQTGLTPDEWAAIFGDEAEPMDEDHDDEPFGPLTEYRASLS